MLTGCKTLTPEETSTDPKRVTWAGLESKTVVYGEKINLLEGITVVDSIDGDITDQIKIVDEDKFSSILPRVYKVEYSVTNSTGVTETKTKTFTVLVKKQNDNVMYTNPVFAPVLADPAVVRDDDGYFYVFGTQDFGKWGSSTSVQYIPILKSNNLVSWEFAGSAFNSQNSPKWGTFNAGLWAPDIVKIGNKYNLYYSLSTWGDPNPGIGVATSDHPLGPWTDHGKIFDSSSIGVNNSIDPAVFVDDDSRVYMIWGSFRGLYGVELTADGLALKDGDNAINAKTRVAGLDTSTPWNGDTYEGAYVIKKDNYYYLFVSSGTCCEGFNSTYNVRVSRSTSPLGPYIDNIGRDMLGTDRGTQVITRSPYFVGNGHNSVIKDDAGDYWIFYHAYDKSKLEKFENTSRRSLMLDKLIWTSDGWPKVQGIMPSNIEQPSPKINQ
jgi:arabinan endo-1,5-alpha-L-arabinosidase